MNLPELLAEIDANHTIKITFCDYDGKDYCCLEIDGARVGGWYRSPAIGGDCLACAARRRKAVKAERKLETRASK